MPKAKPKKSPTQNLWCDPKTGNWNVRVRINGQLRFKSLGVKDLTRARELARPVIARFEAERKAERAGVSLEGHRPRSKITWERVCVVYRGDTDAWPQNERTAERYDLDLDRIGAFLAEQDTLPAEVESGTVKAFVADLRADELSTSTVKHALSVWNCAMEAAVYHELIDENPVKTYNRKRLKDDAEGMRPPLGDDFALMKPDVERLAPPGFSVFTEFLHRTGCRLGEALHARASDIRGEPGSLRIHLHEGVKRGKPRSIMLNSAEELLPLLPRTGRLFSDLSTSVNDVSSAWGRFWKKRRAEAEKAAQAGGKALGEWELRRWRLHDLRHAFAINAILSGANHYALMEHMGHTDFQTTMLYLKAIKNLPVEQRKPLKLFWRGAKQALSDDDGPQPEFTAPDLAALDEVSQRIRQEEGPVRMSNRGAT